MTVVIECETCHSRFRLAKALFKGSQAVRVRCRRCGGPIVVLNPDLPEALPMLEEEPWPAAPAHEAGPAAHEPPSPAAPAEGPVPAPWETDDASEPPEPDGPAAFAEEPGFAAFEEEPAWPAPPEETAPETFPEPDPPAPAAPFEAFPEPEPPEPPPYSDVKVSGLDELLASMPPDDPPLSAGSGWAADPAPHAAPAAPRKVRAVRPPYAHPLFLVGVGLWLVLLAGGALLFFGVDRAGGKAGGTLLPSTGTAPGGGPAARSVYEVRDVTWDHLRKTIAGDLFVVRGTVVNGGAGPSAGIRIHATLVGKDNEPLGERDAFAGNVIDDTTLRHASQSVLQGVLAKRSGDGDRNREIPPGGSIPFMVVFFNPPPEIGSILVKGVDAP